MPARTELFVRKQPGGMFSVVNQGHTTGNIFFVNSATGTNGVGYGQNPDAPFASIHYASTQCTANNGDRIYVMPGHVETVIGAGGLALAVAGVEVIGIGQGGSRPTVTLTTSTAATVTISAANVTVRNILFVGGIDALVSVLVISAADVSLIDCEYRDTSAMQCGDCILTTAAANRLKIQNFIYTGDTAAGTNAGIAIVGGDRILIDGLRMDGNFAVGGIDIRTTATTNLEVRNVWSFRTRNSADIFIIDTITASTGQIGPNVNLRLQDNAANITEACTGATFVYIQPINIVNLAGESSMQTNITASTDA